MNLVTLKYILLFLLISVLLLPVIAVSQEATKILEIDDPLTTGTTVGRQHGGRFTDSGWKTETAFDYIQYDIPTCSNGEIEFDIQGLYASNVVFPNVSYDRSGQVIPGEEDVHYSFFSMWDRDENRDWYGVKQWHNPYKCYFHIFGYVPGDQYKWGRMKLRLNVAAYEGGYDDDPHAFEDPMVGPFDWQKDHVYHHRLVWGNGHMKWYMDGELLKDWDYSSFGEEYAPPYHSMRIGSGFGTLGSSGFKTPEQVTLSNFKFYRYQDLTAPTVINVEPEMIAEGVAVDSDILVHFSESMDHDATAQAFSIAPAVAGQIEWVGNALYFHRSELLSANTTYTIHVSRQAKDRAGNHLEHEYEYQFTTAAQVPAVVGRYQTFEVPLIAPGISGNKYTSVSLRGVFQGPTQTIEIDGFWDGGDVWKVRMAPTEVGHWTYQITSSVPALNASGSFECVESDSKGFVRVNPERPYTFMYDDGTPWLWRGETSWRGFTSLIPYESRWKSYIDLRASQGYTAVQSIVVSYIGGANFWKNEGGLCFSENGDKKDYDKLNPEYFRWIDKRIDYANSKNIVPVIFFTWAQEFAKFSEDQFARFAKYLVSRYAAKNVIWTLCGEYDEIVEDFGMPTSVFDQYGQLVKQADPYDHPITLHPTGRSSSVEFANENWFDFIMEQTPYYVRDIERDRRHNKPVVNGEPRYFYPEEDNTESRYGLWEIASSGGYYTAGFLTTYAPDKGGWDMDAMPDEQSWSKFLNEFLGQIHWWQLDPHPEWTSNGQLMAKPGEEYFAYSRQGGPVTINFTGYLGTLPAKWLDPMNARVYPEFEVQLGGPVTLNPPFEGDWGLFIGHEVPLDSLPPLEPRNLTMLSHTPYSITLRWDEPLPAEDGDVASGYRIYRDGVQVGASHTTTFTDALLTEDTEYLYQVYSLDDAGNQSLSAAEGSFITQPDTIPPYLVRVSTVSLDTIRAHFTEPIDSLDAINLDNYQILQGIEIYSARLLPGGKVVELHTAKHEKGPFYVLITRNIKDRATHPNTMLPNNFASYRFGQAFDVSDLLPEGYQWAYLNEGDQYYLDRDFVLLTIPDAYENLLWIRTRNDDKKIQSDNFVSFSLMDSATVYVGYDKSIADLPGWLNGWSDTGDEIVTSDDNPLRLYAREFGAEKVVLGGNAGGSHNSMYVVLVRPKHVAYSGEQPQRPFNIRLSNGQFN